MKAFVSLMLLVALAGCVGGSASRSEEERVQRLLAKGDYRGAIAKIERGTQTADRQFALGLLYAYRELDENRERSDFSKALALIRSAAPEVEEAQQLLADYEERGSQVFLAFPWAHMIGPFPNVRRPELQKTAHQQE